MAGRAVRGRDGIEPRPRSARTRRTPSSRVSEPDRHTGTAKGPHRVMGTRIYCGNLSFQATENDVRDLFAQYGEVADVHLVMDRESGRSRGFAFVEMATDQQAAAAIQALDGYRHQDRALKVN